MRCRHLAAGLLWIGTATGQQYVISTYAGGAPLPTPIPGREVSIGAPSAVAVDAADNIYFLSLDSVLRLDADGTITRLAGNSRNGDSGDGGPAVNAQLRASTNGLMTHAGSLFIADRGNHRIRKVSPDGIITTVAGNGADGFSGDSGPANGAQLSSPAGIAFDDAGNLYIADWGNSRIRKVSADGIITTVAGVGKCCGSFEDGVPANKAQLGAPAGVAVDGAGNLFIADFSQNRVRKVSPDEIITTVADPGVQAFSGDRGPMPAPTSVTVDAAGNLFITYSGVNRVRKVSPDGTITTVAGGGSAGLGDGGLAAGAQLNNPQGAAVDTAGNLYIADAFNYRIRKVSTGGIITTVAGNGSYTMFSGDGGPATSARLSLGGGDPSALGGVAVDGEGNVFIADTNNHRIRKVSPSGIISTVAGTGTPGYVGNNGLAINAQLKYPLGVAVDGAGNLFIADSGNGYVRKVSPSGIITTISGSDSDSGVAAVSVDGANNLVVAAFDKVRKFSADGVITVIAGGGQLCCSASDGRSATQAKLFWVCGVAVDPVGNLFIADCNDRAHKVSPGGIITTVALPRGSPTGVAADPTGNVFIAASDVDGAPGADHVYKLSADGIVNTIAGADSRGYSGDGGPGTGAQLDGPAGLAVDGAGNIYVADTGNGAVRVLRPADRSDAASRNRGRY